MLNDTIFKILVVDDDLTDLEVLNSILKDDYTVYIAKSGHSALERAEKNKPDLILLDVLMPDMSGYEVLTQLRASAATQHIPVIFITGLNKVQDEEKGFDLGAVDYITKPFHRTIVKARVNAILESMKRVSITDHAGVMLKTKQGIRNTLYRNIMYVDVMGHWLKFHLFNNEVVEIYASLREYEPLLLSDPRFARCHKSFIVNMDYVEVMEKRDAYLKNNERIPISKNYAHFKKQYIDWVKTH